MGGGGGEGEWGGGGSEGVEWVGAAAVDAGVRVMDGFVVVGYV